MTKAMAPMTGGRIWPPADDAASTAPAKAGLYPARIMSGMVTAPVVAALAEGEPEMVPKNADASTAVLAAPPRVQPAMAMASSLNHSPTPAFCSRWANMRNTMTMVEATPSGTPKMPSPGTYTA